MTHKDFQALADALLAARPIERKRQQFLRWQLTCNAIMQACIASNPRFDRGRFERACQYDASR